MRSVLFSVSASVIGSVLLGCVERADAPPGPFDEAPDASTPPLVFSPDATAPPSPTMLPPSDPHAVRGVTPSHGPFKGGQVALVRGAGYGPNVRIWFGDAEVPEGDIVAIDPTRVQVSVPSGRSGPVDVTTQNGDDESTRRTLASGYVYDPFYADPSRGPTSGGTIITLHGNGTHWDESTDVLVDFEPCEVVDIRGEAGEDQELDCRSPAGTPGAKVVRTTSDEETHDVLDAFVYGDSDNGFRGGLSGAALEDELSVLVLGNDDGNPISDATVVVQPKGSAEEQRATTGSTGRATVTGGSFEPAATVTVAAHCRMPLTLASVPVDTITVYLNRVLTPECQPQGDPPSVGGSPRSLARIQGEVVFPGGIEFRRAGWTAVPAPTSPDARLAAYVLELEGDPRRPFRLPSSSEAVTLDSEGRIGYGFDYRARLGNLTLYALAGIEDRSQSPPLFTAYAMGLVRGVLARPDETTESVFIKVDNTLDHAIELKAAGPTPTSRGPDRLIAKIAVRIGGLGYAILPLQAQERRLPFEGSMSIVGLPPLIGSLAGADLAITAAASTGESGSVPRSVLDVIATSNQTNTVVLEEFLQIPRFVVPSVNSPWDGRRLLVDAAAGGGRADISVVEIHTGNGLWHWTIAAPADEDEILLPDPATLPDLGLRQGPITLEISRAHIRGFDYGSLRTSALRPSAWDAYATDTVQAHYE